MQLDATLKSFFRHCCDPDFVRIAILYKATNNQNIKQYETLNNEFQNQGVNFIKETDFGKDFLGILFEFAGISKGFNRLFFSLKNLLHKNLANQAGMGNIFFAVDDTIFVRAFTLQEIVNLLEKNSDALGFSLRLGLNTRFCYTLNCHQNAPATNYLNNDILKYQWDGAEADFGYPLEVSSSIYRIADLLPLLSKIPIKNPSSLEGQMNLHVKEFSKSKKYLLCFKRSVAFSNPVNRVQNLNTNRAGVEFSHTIQDLATLFDDGYRIGINVFDNFIPQACHQEVDLTFEKK
jgi:hypothetical protein